MSGVYLDRAGYARYYEDESTGPLPEDRKTGLTRVPLDADRVWPRDIVAVEKNHRSTPSVPAPDTVDYY